MIDFKYRVYDNGGIQIFDSYKIKPSQYDEVLDIIQNEYPDNINFQKRTRNEFKYEWALHTIAYKLGYEPKQTKDVDFFYPYKDYEPVNLYKWLGPIALIVARFF